MSVRCKYTVVICNQQDESLDHLILHYSFARAIWWSSNIVLRMNVRTSVLGNANTKGKKNLTFQAPKCSTSRNAKSISIGKFQFYSILPFQKAILSLYHTTLQYHQHPKTLFLLKYYFLIFLYYFFPTITFFQTLA